MPWRELLRITPGMFLALKKQHEEHQRSQFLGYQFLATIVARVAGNPDANFMPDSQRPAGWTDEGALATFFEARVVDGNCTNSGEATEGASEGDEGGDYLH